MCIATPYRVLEIEENGRVQIEVGGTGQEISTLLVPEVTAGDYVLVYLSFAGELRQIIGKEVNGVSCDSRRN